AYDAVVFIGGTGASQYWHDVKAHEIARAAMRDGKVVAASSHAPVTLAVAGLLQKKRVTGHVAIYEKLTVHGAEYTGRKLEVDGNLITSSGANAAKEFAEALGKAVS
ncbi:MAG: DJ-1 family protein, partial [Calditrichaeota bacterium]